MEKLTEWCERNGISYTTAWRMRKCGTFPRPTKKIGKVLYVLDEVELPEAKDGHTCPHCGGHIVVRIDGVQ